jgi:predicted O-methyltransferase YrrM
MTDQPRELGASRGALADDVWASPPQAHAGGRHCYSLSLEALRWLERTVDPGMVTLETGTGASTVIFAARGAEHTAISPEPDEHDRIAAWCAARRITTDRVRFVAEPSHVALARERTPVDLALIDGAHGYPYPALDYFYASQRLAAGGLLALDDAQLKPVHDVVDHLRTDDDWRLEEVVGVRLVVFRRLRTSDPTFHGQPSGHVNYDYLPWRGRIPMAIRARLVTRVSTVARLDARIADLRRRRRAGSARS